MNGVSSIRLPLFSHHYQRSSTDARTGGPAPRADDGPETPTAQPRFVLRQTLPSGALSELLAAQAQDPELQARAEQVRDRFGPGGINPVSEEEQFAVLARALQRSIASTEKVMAGIREHMEALERMIEMQPGNRAIFEQSIAHWQEVLNSQQEQLDETTQWLDSFTTDDGDPTARRGNAA